MTVPFPGAWRRATALVAIVGALAACGGGSDGGSVGSGGTGRPQGLATGTVNGFASVVVDGVHFDDRNVLSVQEDALGRDLPAEVKLGHRVEVGFEQPGDASALRLEGAVRGPVSAVTTGQFAVLGQTVRINADPARGPVTQFGGGYASLADVAPDDVVDVHGIVVPQGGTSVIQATRVDRDANPPPFYQVMGIVTGTAAGGGSFRIGTLTVTTGGATVVPAGTVVADGELVRAIALPSALTPAGLAASLIRVKAPAPAGSMAVVSGTIASHDATARTFVVGTQRVDYGSATVAPTGSSLEPGQYVRVRGQLGEDGTIVATEVMVRTGRNEAEAELRGNIQDFDPLTQTFTVRNVLVDASGVDPLGCTAGLAEGVFVEVEGRLGSNGVVATRLECEREPVGGTVERQGTASAVSAATRTFALTQLGRAAVTVSWSDTTLFVDVTPQTLSGQRVKVEGVVNADGVLEAAKVRLHRAPR